MNIPPSVKFIAAVVFQVVVVLVIILFKTSVISQGAEVLLQIQPVDPTDLLRGDYVTFRYVISTTNTSVFSYSPVRVGDMVYVPLAPTGDYWSVSGRIGKSPDTEGNVFIRGTVSRVYGSGVSIQYGVEEYFIPEGEGRNVNFWRRNAAAKVSVSADGSAVLRQIYLDGQPWPR